MLTGKEWLAKFMVAFGYLMALVYIGLGCSLFLHKVFPNIPGNLKITFALFFIAYGAFRMVRLLTRKNESKV